MFKVLTTFFTTALTVTGLAVAMTACAETEGHAKYAEGTHYQLLEKPVAVNDPSKVEVREFFFYGCSHCYDAEPIVEDWLKTKPAHVDFVRTPVLFIKGGEPLARAFYVAEAKGLSDKVHKPMFDAIHKHREPLFTVPALATFFKQYGVNNDEFNELYSSFGVSVKTRQADTLSREYKITGVPSFGVNGKYLVLRSNLKNDMETFQVIDFLVEKERKLLAK